MDPRFLLLDALLALADGNLLHRSGETSYGIRLAGVPLVALILDDLVRYGWITGHKGSAVWFTLSDAGRDALREGAAWYRSLPIWRRLFTPRPRLERIAAAAPDAGPNEGSGVRA